jgi:hypothetical protein
MNKTDLSIINVDADAGRVKAISPIGDVSRVLAALGLDDDTAPPSSALVPSSDVARWIGVDSVTAIGARGVDVLAAGISRLPSAAPADSFVWKAARTPAELETMMKAVVIYQRFNVGAVNVSERIGPNDEFRRFVRQSDAPGHKLLVDVLAAEQGQVDRIVGFVNAVSDFISIAQTVFDNESWNIGSLLALASSVGGLKHSRASLEAGWDLLMAPSSKCLDDIEELRMQLAYMGRKLKDCCGVNFLSYPQASLSGLRRSLIDEEADLAGALDPFNVHIDGDEAIVAFAADLRVFLTLCDRLNAVLADSGYREADTSALISQVLARRYLIAGAEANGVDWALVSDGFRFRSTVTGADMQALIAALETEEFSGRLDNMCQDRGEDVRTVLLAADHYIVSRQFWLDAGNRVVDLDAGLRLMDLRAILEVEPEIQGNSETLRSVGAICRADVADLEKHLAWLLALYDLPISNSDIDRIISNRGPINKDDSTPVAA